MPPLVGSVAMQPDLEHLCSPDLGLALLLGGIWLANASHCHRVWEWSSPKFYSARPCPECC